MSPNWRPRVLALYPRLIPSVEISVLIPLRHLQSQGKIQLHEDTAGIVDCYQWLSWCDIVVFSRCCMVHELSVLEKVRQLGIPYIYDLDDNFFRLAEKKEPTQLFLQQPGVMQTLKHFIYGARVVKTGSAQMVADMSLYNNNVVIHPYVFDFSLLCNRAESNVKDVPIIGYAGSLVHSRDLEYICGALNRIAVSYPDVRFAFYGARPGNQTLMSEALLARSEFIPFQNGYASFIRDLSARGWTIAVAPLEDNICNRSKTNNKYREYAACGIVGIYSNMPLYSACVEDGVNGMLADYTEDSWYAKMAYLLDHPDRRVRIAKCAFEDVKAHCSIETVSDRWINELIMPSLSDKLSSQKEREDRMRSLPFKLQVKCSALVKLPVRCWASFVVRELRERLRSCIHADGK